MRDTELRRERDKELYSLYIRGIREHHFSNTHEAVDWVRSQPASKFYVSSKALVNYIFLIESGRKPDKMFSLNERKIHTLYKNYCKFLKDNPSCKLSRERICELLVDRPASMFFICHDSAMKAILRERKRRIKELTDKL